MLFEFYAACASQAAGRECYTDHVQCVPTALQHLQNARPPDISCIATIISIHDAGYLPKVQQPVRAMLT